MALLAAAVATSSTPASAAMIVSDDFTDPGIDVDWREVDLVDRTPNLANLPGGTWTYTVNDYDQKIKAWAYPDTASHAAKFHNGGSGAISLADDGTYTKPALLRISGDLFFPTATVYAGSWVQLGFFEFNDPNWTFNGLRMDETGGLMLVEDNTPATPIPYAGTFDPAVYTALSFDVNTVTGAISNVTLQGSTSTYSYTTSAFTDAATAYGGMRGSQGNRPESAWLDNFCIEMSSVSVAVTDHAYEDETSPVQGRLVLTRTLMGEPLVVNITVDGTAVLSTGGSGHDYDFDPVTVRQDLEVAFAAAEATVEVLVVPEDNELQDGTRTVEVTIEVGAGYGVADPAPVTLYIFDDDSPPEAFSLSSPTDDATGVSLTPTLAWEEAFGATSYDVTVVRVSDSQVVFTNNVTGGTTTSVDVPPGEALDYGTQYSWTVVAHNDNGDTPHADWGFTTEYALPTVRVEAVEDAYEDPTNPVAGEFLITRYGTGIDRSQEVTVHFTLSADPADPLGPVEAVNGTHYQLVSSPVPIAGAASEEEASVVVQMLPIDDGDAGAKNVVLTLDPDAAYSPSATEDEAKLYIGDDESPPLPFALVAPGDGDLGVVAWDVDTGSAVPVTLSWETAVGAITYTVQIADNSSMTDALEFPTTETDFEVQVDLETTYYWTVHASNSSPDSTEATGASWSFTTEDDLYAPVVREFKPDDGATRVLEDAKVSILFSEPMHPTNTANAFSVRIDGVVDVTADGVTDFVAAGRRLTFKMPGGFANDTTYVCTLKNTATDQADKLNGLDLGGDTELVFSFTTAEALTGLARGKGCAPGGAGSAATLALALSAAAAAMICFRRRTAARRP